MTSILFNDFPVPKATQSNGCLAIVTGTFVSADTTSAKFFKRAPPPAPIIFPAIPAIMKPAAAIINFEGEWILKKSVKALYNLIAKLVKTSYNLEPPFFNPLIRPSKI